MVRIKTKRWSSIRKHETHVNVLSLSFFFMFLTFVQAFSEWHSLTHFLCSGLMAHKCVYQCAFSFPDVL